MKFPKKFPSLNQWLKIFSVMSKKERQTFFVFLALFIFSSLYLSIGFYLSHTQVAPSKGGKFREAIVGQPRFINPIYLGTSDADRDLAEIVFSGLMRYNNKGEIVPDLADTVKIDKEGKIYDVYLKKNLFWHDGKPLKAEDVVFTIKTIQDPEYKSPLRANWLGVKVQEIEESEGLGVSFTLERPYSAFLERLTLKIIPKHIWESIPPSNAVFSNYNLNPVGSGPYKVTKVEQNSQGLITSIELSVFPNYHGELPYIPKLEFKFFDTEDKALSALNKGEVDALSLGSSASLAKLKNDRVKEYSFSWPRYFAVFFNQERSSLFSQKEARQALAYATNKQKIIEKVLMGKGKAVSSPLVFNESSEEPADFNKDKVISLFEKLGFELKDGNLIKKSDSSFSKIKSDLKVGSRGKEVEDLQRCLAQDPEVYPEGKVTGYFGSQTKAAVIRFQEKYSKDILEPWGFKEGTGLVAKTTRAKLNEICSRPKEPQQLELSLVASENQLLLATAEALQEQWQELGIKVNIESYPLLQLEKDFIKPRNYELLLFGQALGIIPDLFPFWHSSQIKDPGLNLALYQSREADKLLEKARTALDPQEMTEAYANLQKVIIKDIPAIFLYTPDHIYLVHKKIKGIEPGIIADPSKRFSLIEEWYIKTKRVWQ